MYDYNNMNYMTDQNGYSLDPNMGMYGYPEDINLGMPYPMGNMQGMAGMQGMQGGYPQNNDNMGGIAPTQQSIKDYVCLASGCYSVDVVDEFETLRARHICEGTKLIQVLNRTFIPVPTTKGMVNVEVFFCPMCRKLIINKSSMVL